MTCALCRCNPLYGLVLWLAYRTTTRSSLKIPLVVFSYLYESFSVDIQIHGKVGAALLVGQKRKMTVSTRSLGRSCLYVSVRWTLRWHWRTVMTVGLFVLSTDWYRLNVWIIYEDSESWHCLKPFDPNRTNSKIP